MRMDHLQLGLGLSTNHGTCLSSESISSDNYCDLMKKRRFDEAFDHDHVRFTTLSLFGTSWKNDPNEDDDEEYKELDKNSFTTTNDGDGGDDEGVVGWPPVNTWRKRLYRGGLTRDYNFCGSNGGGGDGGDVGGSLAGMSKSTHIKVTMEGVAIGRKVDLSLHHSYHTLAHTLLVMFGIDEENMKHYEITYQDIDGDWLLAGDLPWSSFIETARRLKLVKSKV